MASRLCQKAPASQGGGWQVAGGRSQESGTRSQASGFFVLTAVLRRRAVALCAGGCLLASIHTGCAPQQQKITAPQDKPLAAFQTNLLTIAFDVATAIPVNPHIKDRSKAQEEAVTICFELDQPQRALEYAEQIGDWRRGAAYADYAFYCAQHGFTNGVQKYLDLADEISAVADQDWRKDRIKIKISKTHILLGQTEQAGRFATGVDASSSGEVARVEAMMSTEDSFDTQMKELDGLIATGSLDPVKNALYAGAELFNRFYDHPERRALMEDKIKASWKPLPVFVRIELLMKLAEFALSHADQSKALTLANDAKGVMDGFAWPAEYHIPLAARLAALRYRAGDQVAARSELLSEQKRFAEKQAEIINIDKADTLIPVAEAFLVTDAVTDALQVYKQAVEAAVENPNNRPRAEDLTAICLSMAKHAAEPDEALWARIREIQANLGDPW